MNFQQIKENVFVVCSFWCGKVTILVLYAHVDNALATVCNVHGKDFALQGIDIIYEFLSSFDSNKCILVLNYFQLLCLVQV